MTRGTRRHFLSLTATTAAGLLARGSRAQAHDAAVPEPHQDPLPALVDEDPRAFFLGVAAADATSDGAWLWTRYDGDAPLRLSVWQKDGDTWRQVLQHDTPAGARGAVLIPVTGLAPAQEHRYAFYATDHGVPVRRSRVGRFKTAPADDALVPITLGAVCCTMNGRGQEVLAAAGARRDLDAMLFLGDAVYADGCSTQAEYRMRWWENLEQPGYQALRSSTHMIATWDDHEVNNDWNPETIDAQHLACAKDAFFEHTPMCRDEEHPGRIWRSMRFGRTVEVFVLDSRGERRRSASPPQYLSRQQMDWLKDGLLHSKAMFKVIANSVPISRFPQIFASTRQDRWEMFPQQRDEILAFTESGKVPGVLWVAGDFHLAMLARPSVSGIGSKSLEVLAGPGAQLGHPLVPFLWGRQYDWSSARNNVCAMRFDPARERVTFSFCGDDGKPFHEASYRRKQAGFEKLDDIT